MDAVDPLHMFEMVRCQLGRIERWVLFCQHILHLCPYPNLRFRMSENIELLVLDGPKYTFSHFVDGHPALSCLTYCLQYGFVFWADRLG